MTLIRPAVVLDVEWIFKCCEDFAAFYQSKLSLAGNPEYGKQFLENMILNHFVMIGEVNGERAGFIAGLVSPHHFNLTLNS